MARARDGRQGRERGSIDELPSGALRVRVYAGMDPVSKRRHYLTKVVPAGPTAATHARALRDLLVREVEARRSPRTSATVEHSSATSTSWMPRRRRRSSTAAT